MAGSSVNPSGMNPSVVYFRGQFGTTTEKDIDLWYDEYDGDTGKTNACKYSTYGLNSLYVRLEEASTANILYQLVSYRLYIDNTNNIIREANVGSNFTYDISFSIPSFDTLYKGAEGTHYLGVAIVVKTSYTNGLTWNSPQTYTVAFYDGLRPSFTVHDRYLDSISKRTSANKTLFLRNEAFEYTGLTIWLNYKMYVSHQTVYKVESSGFVVTTPDMGVIGDSIPVSVSSHGKTADLYTIKIKKRRWLEVAPYSANNVFGSADEDGQLFVVGSGETTNINNQISSFAIAVKNDEGQTDVADCSSSATFSRTTVSYQDLMDTTTNQYGIAGFNITVTYTYDEVTLTTAYIVYVAYKRVVGLELTGTDSNVYYYNRTNIFQDPNLTAKLVYNDGSKVELDTFAYREYDNIQANVLVDNTSVLTSGITTIYVIYPITDPKGTNYSVSASHSLAFTTDTISSISTTVTDDFVLGNTYQDLKSILTVEATYASGYVDSDYQNYTFNGVDMTDFILSSIASVTVKAEAQSETVSLTGVTFSNPTYSYVEVVGDYRTAINNLTDSLDFRDVKLKVHYSNASYVPEYSLSSTQTASTSNYSIKAYKSDNSELLADNSISYYNGTNEFNASMSEAVYNGCYYLFTYLDYFSSSSSTKSVEFKLMGLTDVKGMKIGHVYADYKVGDTFLNENDDTTVIIYYEENSVIKYTEILLRNAYSSLSIAPQKGTVFTNVDASKTVRINYVMNNSIYCDYTIRVEPKSYTKTTLTHDLVAVWVASIVLPNGTLYAPQKGVLELVAVEDTVIDLNGIRQKVSPVVKVWGYIDDIFDEDKVGKVVLYDDYLPPVDGSANIEVTYPSLINEASDQINKCHFGILFGSNNAGNRLFVSGNPDMPNFDWNSGELNSTYMRGEISKINGDFSYFNSDDFATYGETDNKVIGYDIVSNDKLLVLKDKSDKEKTVYFRTPTLVTAVNASGTALTDFEGNALYTEKYSVIKGNNSVAGVSPKTILNFNGDTLFLDSNKQISGLDLTGTIGDNQRYATSRSKYIDAKLKELDLTDAIMWSDNEYLFLSVKNIGLFVTHFETRADGQYEWWFLTSNNPSSFIKVDNDIYIGNDDGVFSKLFNGKFEDIKKLFVGKGQSLLASTNSTSDFIQFDGLTVPSESIIVDNAIISQMSSDKHYKFKLICDETDYKNNIFMELATLGILDDDDIYINSVRHTLQVKNRDILPILGENQIFYLGQTEANLKVLGVVKMDCVAGSAFEGFGVPYRLVRYEDIDDIQDYDEYKLEKLISGVWTEVDVAYLNSANLCKRLDMETDITDISTTSCSFRLKYNGEYVNIVRYGEQEIARMFKAEIREYKKIDAYYITAPMLSSNINTFKTIWSFTLTNDTKIASSLTVAYASNKIPYSDTKNILRVSRDAMGIDFGDLTFDKVDFDKNVVPRTYTVNRVLPRLKFICFAFKNTNGNAVLSSMCVTYTIPYPSFGSD